MKSYKYFQGKNLVGGNNELVNGLLGALSGNFESFHFFQSEIENMCRQNGNKIACQILSGNELHSFSSELKAGSC